MENFEERYDMRMAASWILGHARHAGIPELPPELREMTAERCSDEALSAIVSAGAEAGLKLYPFKTGTQVLPRVRRTMGFLRSLSFSTLLDVGSGRGVFLIPFLKDFPWVSVRSLDLLDKRVTFLNELADGGPFPLLAEKKDICTQPFPEKSFDAVTMLEVLEHIPDVGKAVTAAVRIARQCVVVTVPSKPDSNPEHIHLLTKEKLTRMFNEAGCERLHFDGVEGHLFMVGMIDR